MNGNDLADGRTLLFRIAATILVQHTIEPLQRIGQLTDEFDIHLQRAVAFDHNLIE